MLPIGNKSNGVTHFDSAKDVGSYIKARRRALGLTQSQLADQSNVGRRFLLELEDGKDTAQLGKILKVLSMLGVSLTPDAAT
jgi:HTH-type transcriptional regulator/antitoxin HipB